MSNSKEQYRVLKINGLSKKILLELNSESHLYKKYDMNLFDSNVKENSYVVKYLNVDDNDEFIFITVNGEKEGK